MTRFEYATETFDSDHEKKINHALDKRGIEGWELVSAAPVGLTQTRLFYKRAVEADSQVAA
ncbi:MAG: hypothetical protein HWE26_22385 [Alteromonadaceae bacterium]|nr:hypothetical protein [Alteromonadaceae bacterium]